MYKKLNPERNASDDVRTIEDIMAATKLKVQHQNLSSENLENIKWSDTSIPLSDFVSTYPLPQIVQIEEGYHGGSDENSLSMGQVLKIHTLTTERKLVCEDRHEKEITIPVHNQKIFLKPSNYDTVYQRVSDLSHTKPLPKYVEVTRGYYNVDSTIDYELSIDPGETLEVIDVNESSIFTKKNRSMTFRNSEGVALKLPFDCVAGFKPLIDNTPHLLMESIPSETNNISFPFYFQFVDASASKMGVIRVMSTYDDQLIIASCGQGHSQVVFMISQNLKVKVKVAVGTLKDDPEYESVRRSYHNFKSLEVDLKKSYSFRKRAHQASTSDEVFGIQIPPTNEKDRVNGSMHPNWEIFDENTNDTNEGATTSKIKESTSDNFKLGETSAKDDPQVTLHQTAVETPKLPEIFINGNDLINGNVHTNGQSLTNGDSLAHRNSFTNGDSLTHRNSFTNGDSHTNADDQPVDTPPVSEIQQNNSTNEKTKKEFYSTIVDPLDEIKSMSVETLAETLRGLNMEKHVEQFTENQVDGTLFCELEEDELKDLGLNKFEIKKLFRYKNGWRPKLI